MDAKGFPRGKSRSCYQLRDFYSADKRCDRSGKIESRFGEIASQPVALLKYFQLRENFVRENPVLKLFYFWLVQAIDGVNAETPSSGCFQAREAPISATNDSVLSARAEAKACQLR